MSSVAPLLSGCSGLKSNSNITESNSNITVGTSVDECRKYPLYSLVRKALDSSATEDEKKFQELKTGTEDEENFQELETGTEDKKNFQKLEIAKEDKKNFIAKEDEENFQEFCNCVRYIQGRDKKELQKVFRSSPTLYLTIIKIKTIADAIINADDIAAKGSNKAFSEAAQAARIPFAYGEAADVPCAYADAFEGVDSFKDFSEMIGSSEMITTKDILEGIDRADTYIKLSYAICVLGFFAIGFSIGSILYPSLATTASIFMIVFAASMLFIDLWGLYASVKIDSKTKEDWMSILVCSAVSILSVIAGLFPASSAYIAAVLLGAFLLATIFKVITSSKISGVGANTAFICGDFGFIFREGVGLCNLFGNSPVFSDGYNLAGSTSGVVSVISAFIGFQRLLGPDKKKEDWWMGVGLIMGGLSLFVYRLIQMKILNLIDALFKLNPSTVTVLLNGFLVAGLLGYLGFLIGILMDTKKLAGLIEKEKKALEEVTPLKEGSLQENSQQPLRALSAS